MTDQRLPRLGDREDLTIEILPAAISTYRQSIAESWMGPAARDLTEPEAREELDDVLRHSYVTYSSSDAMRVRARVRRLEVDCEAQLVRVSSTHVRCIFARARRLDVRTSAAGSRTGDASTATWRVYDRDGRRIGFLRAPRGGGQIEYRAVAAEPGALAPPWEPLPQHVREIARHNMRLAEWLRERGVEEVDE